MLNIVNKHTRDENIEFFEEQHVYIINKDPNFISVTGLVKLTFPPVNPDTIISKIRRSSKYDSTNKYFNMTDEEIKNLWYATGAEACSRGTSLHKNIEKYYNKEETSIDQECKEWLYFKQFVEDTEREAYRTEWMIYDETYKVCGTLDMIYKNPDGTYDIVDWKRTKKLSKARSVVPSNTFYWLYTLQLNLYKFILEKNYDIKISNLYIVQLHPDQDSYKIYQMQHIDDYVIKLMDKRLNDLKT